MQKTHVITVISLALLLVTAVSCSVDKEQKAAEFKTFLEAFGKDRQFQMQHIDFPLTVEAEELDYSNGDLDSDSHRIEPDQWDHVAFESWDSGENSGTYVVSDVSASEISVTYEEIGASDNQFPVINYIFEARGNAWNLVKVEKKLLKD